MRPHHRPSARRGASPRPAASRSEDGRTADRAPRGSSVRRGSAHILTGRSPRAGLSTGATIIGPVDGLPGLRCGWVHLRATRRWCRRASGSGVTSRCIRSAFGNAPATPPASLHSGRSRPRRRISTPFRSGMSARAPRVQSGELIGQPADGKRRIPPRECAVPEGSFRSVCRRVFRDDGLDRDRGPWCSDRVSEALRVAIRSRPGPMNLSRSFLPATALQPGPCIVVHHYFEFDFQTRSLRRDLCEIAESSAARGSAHRPRTAAGEPFT
jgi:hypothetical protein